ncbi:STAS/SEC14 domain-containing protein [candidate division WOR-3 bacterium]|nr:STAS/SEC14 domain-containing protein [candidate division WOR-3 bacterium]
MKHQVWFDSEHGICFLKLRGTFSPDDGAVYIPRIQECYKGIEKHYLLCDLTEGGTELPTEKSYRRWLIEMYERIGFDRIAMYNAKPAMRMLAKIVLTAAGKSNQVRFFSSQDDAIQWLKRVETAATKGVN